MCRRWAIFSSRARLSWCIHTRSYVVRNIWVGIASQRGGLGAAQPPPDKIFCVSCWRQSRQHETQIRHQEGLHPSLPTPESPKVGCGGDFAAPAPRPKDDESRHGSVML